MVVTIALYSQPSFSYIYMYMHMHYVSVGSMGVNQLVFPTFVLSHVYFLVSLAHAHCHCMNLVPSLSSSVLYRYIMLPSLQPSFLMIYCFCDL